MMNIKDLLDYCRAQAIINTLGNDEVSVWRSICRTYSNKFATPLHLCLNGTIPAEDIMLAVFEDQLEDFKEDDLENLLDTLYGIEDPEYERRKEDDLEEFMEKAERDEEERLRKGKPVHKSSNDEVSLSSKKTVLKKPLREEPLKGGGVDFSHIQDEEKEGGKF